MSLQKPDVQGNFLRHLRDTRQQSTVFLVNGVKLQGVVTWVDDTCLLLTRDSISQLVYKHAISTVMPSEPVPYDKVVGDDNLGNK